MLGNLGSLLAPCMLLSLRLTCPLLSAVHSVASNRGVQGRAHAVPPSRARYLTQCGMRRQKAGHLGPQTFGALPRSAARSNASSTLRQTIHTACAWKTAELQSVHPHNETSSTTVHSRHVDASQARSIGSLLTCLHRLCQGRLAPFQCQIHKLVVLLHGKAPGSVERGSGSERHKAMMHKQQMAKAICWMQQLQEMTDG